MQRTLCLNASPPTGSKTTSTPLPSVKLRTLIPQIAHGVVDRLVGAVLAGNGELLRAACGCDDAGTQQLAHLDRR